MEGDNIMNKKILIKPGTVMTNKDLVRKFKCPNSGGIRPSNTTNTIVLICNHTKSLYQDRWEGNILYYTGTGRIGDQELTGKNKTLAESKNKSKELYLFEVFEPQKYVYTGKLELVGKPFYEKQLDEKGNLRKVLIFPLGLIEDYDKYILPYEYIKRKEVMQKKKVKKLTTGYLYTRALNANVKSWKRLTKSYVYETDPHVEEFAKRWADGICQLCEKPAPFKDKQGEPYLKIHHIDWLSRGGEDSIYNTIALCPNCHEKMHVLDQVKDVKKLKRKIKYKVNHFIIKHK